MDHEQATELLSEYLESELAPEQAEAFERHLEGCQECRQTLAMLQQAMRAVSRLPEARAPAHFARRVQLRARRAGLVRPRRSQLMERVAVPFSSSLTTWGLLLTVGLLLLVVMIAQQQIELLTLPAPIPVVDLEQPDQLTLVEAVATRLGLQIEPKPAPDDPLELSIPGDAWTDFVEQMEASGLGGGLPVERPEAGPDGRIHLRFRVRPGAQRPGGATGASP